MSALRKVCCQLAIAICLAIALTGCVRYETTIDFVSFNSGAWVQHITIDRQFQQLNRAAVAAWMQSIEQRTRQIQGRVQTKSERELTAIVPFRTAPQLVAKFAQFFAGDRELLSGQLAIDTNNLLVVSRHHLTYDLDLSFLADRTYPLGDLADQPAVDLQLALNVPAVPLDLNRSQRWQLQPGRVNHLSAVFWLPNPLGIGSLVIMLVVALGYFIKSKF